MILGIDIGTTTIGYSICDNSAHQIEACSTPSPASMIMDGPHRCQDAGLILDKVSEIVATMCGQYEIEKIAFTGQMHGIVICDNEGIAISPLYTWQDECANELSGSGKTYCEEICEATGYHVHAGYGLATLYYLTKTGKLPSGASKISTIMDYVAMRICDNNEPCIHPSNAASLGLFDIEAGSFDTEKIKACGIECSILPKVCSGADIIGQYNEIDVVVAIGDNQASVLSSVGKTEGGICLNYGTGSQISYISSSAMSGKGIEVRPYVDDLYLNCGSALCGGRAYAILKDFFGAFLDSANVKDIDIYSTLNKLASEGIDSPLMVNTQFAGTREDANDIGSIVNLDQAHFTPSSLASGVLYGMARELHTLYENMGSPTFSRVVTSGGIVQKCKPFNEVLKRVFMCEIEVSTTKEEAAHGACIFAM